MMVYNRNTRGARGGKLERLRICKFFGFSRLPLLLWTFPDSNTLKNGKASDFMENFWKPFT